MLYQRRVCLCVLIACVLGLVFLSTTSARADCPEGLTSYWTLDETSGSTYVDLVNRKDGVGNESPTPANGLVFSAQDFDGSTTGIDVEPDDSFDWGINESFSIEYWVNDSSSSLNSKVVVGRDDTLKSKLHWWTGLRPSGEANFTLRDADGVIAEVEGKRVNDGEWHHVAAVRDADTDPKEIRLYVDGVEQASVDAVDYTAGFDSEKAELNIGYLNRKDDPERHRFNGTLDEVAIYNRVLSPEEISQHYNEGLSYCGGLARYSLTVNTDGGAGTGTVNPDGGVYHEGTTVLLTADSATGSAFFEWNTGGDLSGHANPAAIAMTGDKTVTAAFEPDFDEDGVCDLEEQGGDGTVPDYDGNGDLIADSGQQNVASMYTYDARNYVTLEVEAPGILSDCRTVPPPPNGPAGINFPYGWFGFTVEGAAVPTAETTVKLYLPGATTTYYKYGPTTPGDPTEELYEFLYETGPPVVTGAEINGNTVTLHFIDGELGDDVLGVADTEIVDQGGPGAPAGGGAVPAGGGGGGGCFLSILPYGFRR